MILKVSKDFIVFKQRDYCEVIYCSWLSYTQSNVFTTTEENKAALLLFCELGISSQDQFCVEIEVNLWIKKGKQIISKTVRASKLTWQRTQQINNAHLNRSPVLLTAFARSDEKNFFIHSELTEANKALFLLRKRSYLKFRHFLLNHWCLSLQQN